MLKVLQGLVKLSIGILLPLVVCPRSIKADVSPNNPILTESFCLELVERTVSQTRAGNWQISEQDRSILNKCRAKFSNYTDSTAPLPQLSECLAIVKKFWATGSFQSTFAGLSEERALSLNRCNEVLAKSIVTYRMSAGSMLPTLTIEERVIIDRTAYKSNLPQRGDIIAFRPTATLQKENFKYPLIKRIIGIPGDRIEGKDGRIYINGNALAENYIKEPIAYEHKLTLVPANSYFVLGDNRNNSYDSHYWGFVPRDLIIGKLVWQSGSNK
jgi:signal peptidase I